MKVYAEADVRQIQSLRSKGLTYREINLQLGLAIPKSTLSYICRNVDLDDNYHERMKAETHKKLTFIRELARKKNQEIFDDKLAAMRAESQYVLPLMEDKQIAKVALAMLYLGEGAKWEGRRGLMLGSADPKIVLTYIELLGFCFNISRDQMHCRIQHRADQNGSGLLEYWSRLTGIPKERFYPNYIDKRTVGKITKKLDYKGVCSVTCAGTHIQLELAIIADIIYRRWGISSVG